MTRRELLAATAAGALGAQAPRRRPNILLILADDLGYGDLGCYGQRQILTPNLDRLAAEGIRFTQGYAGSTVCAPSRCCLFTGLHTGHARIRGNGGGVSLQADDLTVTEVLKKAGYRTGMFGKWALGGLGNTGYPTKKGFDEWFGYFSQTHAHTYYPEHLLNGDREVLVRGNFGAFKKDYAPDLFTERALQFLAKKDGRPFFLYLPYPIPHANNELGRDTGDGIECPTEEPYADKPWPKLERKFAATITRLDEYAGRILTKLKELGEEENTLVLVSSDNGPHQEGGHSPKFFESGGALRGIKRDLYEGGIRVPLIARWKGRIAPGQVSDFPWAFWDLLPTAAELAGESVPQGRDGMSVVPTLLGRAQAPHSTFYWEFHERRFSQALRAGDWKLIRQGGGRQELFHLRQDGSERNDVAAKYPSEAARLGALMDEARSDSPDFPVKRALLPPTASRRAAV